MIPAIGRSRRVVSSLMICALGSTGCAYFTGSAAPPLSSRPCCTGGPTDLTAVYLGAGGWIMEWDGEMVLGAPLFTNPAFLTVGMGHLRSDTARVEELLPPVDAARAILVGHAHYDHLLDVPWIARNRASDAWILGNRTTANILAGDRSLDPARVHVMNDLAGSRADVGEWVVLPGERVRVMPLLTQHAPHFQGVELFEGTVDRPVERLPTAARDWVGGQGIAYLIEFLRPGGEVAYRVYYSDISASTPWGFPPSVVGGSGRAVDLAILTAPSFHEADWFPEGVLEALRPRALLLGHWEDFFQPWTRTPNPLALSDFRVLSSRVERAMPPGTLWALPMPGDTVKVGAPQG